METKKMESKRRVNLAFKSAGMVKNQMSKPEESNPSCNGKAQKGQKQVESYRLMKKWSFN